MKRYIKPETEITVIRACNVICTSPAINDQLGDGKQLSKERGPIDFSNDDSWKY